MALSNEEKQALIELKQNGYSFEDAMGFIATNRSGNTSKVERQLSQSEPSAPVNDSAGADLAAGFQGAQQAFSEGLDRSSDAKKRGSTLGKLGAGFRFAGDAIGSIAEGAIRALPGGTTVMNKVQDAASRGAEKALSTPTAQKTTELYGKLPENVRQTVGDVGNIAMGALGIGEALVAPGATKALTTGVRTFAESGIKEVGQAGIQSSIKTGLAPEDLMQRVARISKGKQAAFEERAGQSVGEYLVDRGIFGDPEAITQQLYDRMQTSKGRVDNALAKVGGTYQDDAVLDALEQLAEREARVSTDRTASPDQRRVNELLNKHNNGGLTLAEVNETKRLYERNVKLDYLRDNVSDNIAKANNIDSKLREFVEQKATQGGFANVKALNKETMLARQLLDDLGAEYAGQAGNNYISLSDALFLAEAASNPTALAAFGLKKGLSSKSTMSTVAQMLARKRTPRPLPDENVQGPLGLPPKGQTSAPEAPAVPLGARSQSTIDAQEQARVQAQLRPGDSTPTPPLIKNITNATEDATETIRAQMLDIPETGLADTADGGVIRTTSFPNWVPSELRSKKLFEEVWKHIDNGTTPKPSAHRQWELYALTQNEIKRVEFDKLAKENNWQVGWDDIPFSIAVAAGLTSAAYVMDDDSALFPVVGVIGMIGMSPQKRLALINKQIKKLAIAEDKLIADGAKRTDAPVKSIIEARKKLVRERESIPSF